MKTALVTGASSGIGAAIARQLIADGYRVFVGARRVDRMRELVDAGATALSLDVTDDASIVAAMNTIRDGAGRLDVLVNNAGYGSYGSLEEVPIDEARRQFEVNVFGLARLTQLALPMMRAQKSGTVVNITSIGGKIYEPFGAWYHASKFAVEGMSDSLRMELAPFGINVVIIEPGAIKTEWTEISRLNLLQHSGSGPYKPYAESHANMLAKADRASVASPPEVVAATVSRALKARRPHTRYATGSGARIALLARALLPDRWFDAVLRRFLSAASG